MDKTEIYCTLCKSKEIEGTANSIRNNTDPNCKMYICKNCETHFMWPLTTNEALEKYYDGDFRTEVHTEAYYDKARLDATFARFSVEAGIRVERVKCDLNLEDEILEIGCASGYFLNAIEPFVKCAYGTEWDSQFLSYIRDNLDGSKIKVSKNPQDFDKKFDKIFLFHVLEHIAEPIEYLFELKSLLKEDGKIYIEVPNVDDIMVKTFHCDAFINYYYKKAHLYNFNEKGLRYIFENAEYEAEIEYVQRYDISNHFYWLAIGLPGGKGKYKDIFPESLAEEYEKALKVSKQADTLFAKIHIKR